MTSVCQGKSEELWEWTREYKVSLVGSNNVVQLTGMTVNYLWVY